MNDNKSLNFVANAVEKFKFSHKTEYNRLDNLYNGSPLQSSGVKQNNKTNSKFLLYQLFTCRTKNLIQWFLKHVTSETHK